MEDQNSSSFGTEYSGGVAPIPHNKKKPILIAVIIGLVLLIGGGLTFLFGANKKDESPNTAKNDPKAVATLYDALEKGASQQNIRVAQYRTTYATKADLESKNDPGFIQSSIGELVNNKYRSVYAQRMYDKTEFRMERCMDDKAYIDGLGTAFGSQRPAPTSLPAANEYLKQMYRATETFSVSTCPFIGVMSSGVLDLAPARMSDGLMPVTLTAAQAKNWKDKLKAANLFAVSDEGMVTRDGKQLRKFSFVPQGDASTINSQLQDIFYETGEIEKIKREHPDAQWRYEFIPINISAHGGLKGYYLIDEQTGLPVFSELQGIGEDKDKSDGSAVKKANLGVNKQTYAYPQASTIELTTPLEIIE